MTTMNVEDFLGRIRPALASGDAEKLAATVRAHWNLEQLCPLLGHASAEVRRAVAVVLGLVGDRRVIGCLFKALKDIDLDVNRMAEHGLWSVWFRSGSAAASVPFREGMALVESDELDAALTKFRQAIQLDPDFAEAYNQAGIVLYLQGRWRESMRYCCRAIQRMPMHFGAIAGLGHCYAQLGDLTQALSCYRRALRINPNMPLIARATDALQQRIRDVNDSSGIYGAQAIGV